MAHITTWSIRLALAFLLASCNTTPTPVQTPSTPVVPTIAPTKTALPTVLPNTNPPLVTLAPTPTAIVVSIADPTLMPDDLTPLSDEFDDANTLSQWQDLGQVEQFSNYLEALDINQTSLNHLYLVPTGSAWVDDYRGVFLFKEVAGDFDVRVRLQTTGEKRAVPESIFSLAGIMARAPRSMTSITWQPGGENWVFITTGYGDLASERINQPQIETKTTVNSVSNLRLIVSRTGWVYLRVVRLGPAFIMLYRYEDTDWMISRRFQRDDFPEVLQVGINAYSGWQYINSDARTFIHLANPGPANLIVRYDYFRIQRPRVAVELREEIAQGGSNTQAILAAIGP